MSRKSYITTLVLLLVFSIVSTATALPPSRHGMVFPYTRSSWFFGKAQPAFPKEIQIHRLSPQGGKYPYAASPAAAGGKAIRPLAITPAGVLRPLVVLIEFSDKSRTLDNSAFTDLFFDNTYSVANYWNEVSYGNFTLTTARNPDSTSADIVGWFKPVASPAAASEFASPITLYSEIVDPVQGVNTTNLASLLTAVVSFLDNGIVNMSNYANPSTGEVQSLILVHAGFGAEDKDPPGGPFTELYSHSAAVGPISTSKTIGSVPVKVRDYMAVPERLTFTPRGSATTPSRIGAGVIAHEMGHLLGLPDLYPTSGETSSTGYTGVGIFDLMGYGLWGDNALNQPDVPNHLSAWSKTELGWLTPKVLSAYPGTNPNTLDPAESLPGANPQSYKVYPNGPGDESQYFLLELRGKDAPSTFDRSLPGNGVLIWRVDNEKMDAWRASSATPLLRSNTVNNDNDFLALGVQEADLDNTSFVPHLIQPFSIGSAAFGVQGDFFNDSVQVKSFDRNSPVGGQNRTNSSPTINTASTKHLFDSGFLVTIYNYVVQVVGSIVNATFRLLVELPFWKSYTFTDSPLHPLTSVLSFGFDSSNRTWIGTGNQGVWINSITSWKQIDTFRSHRIQAMVFEPTTGSMWVGTDNSIEKVRLDSIQATLPSSPASANVKAIRIAGDLTKWLGGPRLLAAVTDAGTNQSSDLQYFDLSFKIPTVQNGTESITCMALDSVNFPTDRTKDVLYIGTSTGNIYRNIVGGSVSSLYNLTNVAFEAISFPGPGATPTSIHSLEMDKNGILWGATDKGVFVFDRGDPGAVPVPLPDLFNPFDLAGDNVLSGLYYFPHPSASIIPVVAGVDPRGLALQDTGQDRQIVWVAYGDNNSPGDTAQGGAERIDPNVLVNTRIPKSPAADRIGHATMVFSQGVPNGPAVGGLRNIIGSAGDGSSNVWFATNATGAVRFGSGASLSLDRIEYINDSAIAHVSLVDENAGVASLSVLVTSSADAAGFDLTLVQGADNVYRGSFGFTTGATDNTNHLIAVANATGIKTTITVTYRDTNPPSTKTATATWKKEFPFSDSLWIPGGCFIATAAYGSIMAPEVQVLRVFRDEYLVTNLPGRMLVSFYYRVSPPMAAVISKSAVLRFVSRCAIAPVALFSFVAVETGSVEKMGILMIVLTGMSVPVLAGGWRRNRKKILQSGGPTVG